MHKPVVDVSVGTMGSEDTKCYRKFHRPKDKKSYHKPDRLVIELKKLFNMLPALTAVDAYKRLEMMKDTDGGMLFHFNQRGEIKKFNKTSKEYKIWEGCSMCGKKPCSDCTGKLISAEEIKTYFSSLA